jgi:pimeloyl-ACP methyl ester carboxylesterase
MPGEDRVGAAATLARMASYLDAPRSLRPPIWREFTPTLPSPPARRRLASGRVTASRSRTVMLVPGFLAPDESTTALRAAIRGAGHRTHHARLGNMNGCSEVLASKLVDRVDALAASGGTPVTLVGHSRGGQLAKVAARRRPDLVDGLITLGSPLTDAWGMHLALKLLIATMSQVGRRRLRIGGCGDAECPFGACSTTFFEDLRGELAEHVPFTSIYSRRDGIVQWRTCLDPHARHVEVRCSHIAMALDPAVSAEILRSLAQTPTEPPA